MTREITKISKPILKERLQPLTKEQIKSVDVKNLIQDMRETMIQAKGVGLAANQVNENLRIFVIDQKLAEENKISDVFINPEITEYSKDPDEMEEGCLSIPSFYRDIKRAKKIKIKAFNEKGEKFKLKVRGFLARVLQHETDHLNGILIKDR